MIDIRREQLITFAQAARKFPRKSSGKRLNAMTIARWARTGFSGRILESTKVGRMRLTSIEAIQRFLEQSGMAPKVAPSDDTRKATEYLKAEGF